MIEVEIFYIFSNSHVVDSSDLLFTTNREKQCRFLNLKTVRNMSVT